MSAPIRRFRQYERLTPRERRAHYGAREVIAYARENDLSVYRAIEELRSKGVRTSIGSVKRYFGNALRTDWRGRVVTTETDPNLRVMRMLTTEGMRDVYVRGWRSASIVGQYDSALRAARLGDEVPLRSWRARHGERTFRGVDGGTYAPETDPDVITERDERGELEFEEIYPETW